MAGKHQKMYFSFFKIALFVLPIIHRYICKTVRRYVRHPAENPQYRALPLKMRLKIELHARFPRTMKTISNIKHTLLR